MRCRCWRNWRGDREGVTWRGGDLEKGREGEEVEAIFMISQGSNHNISVIIENSRSSTSVIEER
jgi:hypothetical protein